MGTKRIRRITIAALRRRGGHRGAGGRDADRPARLAERVRHPGAAAVVHRRVGGGASTTRSRQAAAAEARHEVQAEVGHRVHGARRDRTADSTSRRPRSAPPPRASSPSLPRAR